MNLGTALVVRANARRLPLADSSVDLVVTSPPYFALRSYQDGGEHYDGQIGDEPTPAEFVASLLEVTAECVRVLKPSGSLWVNLGDKYQANGPVKMSNQKAGTFNGARRQAMDPNIAMKSLIGIPWRYALACIDDLGLILRAEVIWSKPNGLPESVTDRVRRSHETWFHFTREPRYFSAVDEIREPHAGEFLSSGARNARHKHDGVLPHERAGAWHDVNPDRKDGGNFAGNRSPLGKLPGSVWTIPTEPLRVPDHLGIDHFAAFPTEWPKRIIQGWSPTGVCVECGEGRRPVVEETGRIVSSYDAPELGGTAATTHRDGNGNAVRVRAANGHNLMKREKVQTGYTCACDSDGYRTAQGLPLPQTRPAVVLDPFGGTGTTAMVAKALGRTGISVDMSADYCRLAQWRTGDRNQLATILRIPRTPTPDPEQMTLWA